MDEEILSGSEQATPSGTGSPSVAGEVPTSPALGGDPTTPSAASPTLEGTPAPEQLHEVKVNGKTLKVGLKELLNGYSRHSAHTQAMQALAKEREGWTTRLSQYENAIRETRALLSDRARLAQILQQLPQGDGEEGDEILTRKQVEDLRTQWFNEFREEQQRQVQAERYQAQVQQLKEGYLSDLKGVYDSYGEKFPQLKKLPLFDALRVKVGSFEPASIEDAKALLANEIRELVKENGWDPAGASAPKGVSGIEPPGGVGVMPAEGRRFASVRDPGLKEAVLGDIEQIMRASLQS